MRRSYIAQSAGGQAAALEMVPTWVLVLSTGLQSVVLAPFIALVIVFGEEYGWRGFLQRRLIRLGKLRGVLLVGVIWGVWHAPIIAMGHNYPGYPVAGIFLMTLYTIAMGGHLGAGRPQGPRHLDRGLPARAQQPGLLVSGLARLSPR